MLCGLLPVLKLVAVYITQVEGDDALPAMIALNLISQIVQWGIAQQTGVDTEAVLTALQARPVEMEQFISGLMELPMEQGLLAWKRDNRSIIESVVLYEKLSQRFCIAPESDGSAQIVGILLNGFTSQYREEVLDMVSHAAASILDLRADAAAQITQQGMSIPNDRKCSLFECGNVAPKGKKFSKCASCGAAWYCSRVCQVSCFA